MNGYSTGHGPGIVGITLLLLAACDQAVPAGDVLAGKAAEEKAAADQAAKLSGWDRFFGAPQTAVGAANQFGFRAPDYAQAGDRFRSEGGPVMMSSTLAKTPSTATFSARGRSPVAIERLSFTLAITDPADADTAKLRFSTLIRDFLYQAKADGFVPVGGAIAAEAPGAGELDGARWALARDPLPTGGETRRLTVTFTPAGASPASRSS